MIALKNQLEKWSSYLFYLLRSQKYPEMFLHVVVECPQMSQYSVLTLSTEAAAATAMKRAKANTVFIIACYLLVFLWRNETLLENELTFI